MKIRTLLSTALILAALALTAVGQTPSPTPPRSTGLTINWQITLRGASADNWAIADYTFQLSPSAKKTDAFTKFTVVAQTPGLRDGTNLNVFIGPSSTPEEPYGKLVGIIVVNGGSGAMVLTNAKTPTVQKGTTVTVVNARPTPNERNLNVKGAF